MITANKPTVGGNGYQAYLVRLWQDSEQTPWRASTQCAQTGEKRFFADLAALYTFLMAQTTEQEKGSQEI